MFAVAEPDAADLAVVPAGELVLPGAEADEDQVRALFEEIVTAEWPDGPDGPAEWPDGPDGAGRARTDVMAGAGRPPGPRPPVESAGRPSRRPGRRPGTEGLGRERSPPPDPTWPRSRRHRKTVVMSVDIGIQLD